MKRIIYSLALAATLSLLVFAQEPPKNPEHQTGEAANEPDEMMGWKLANFALLAFGLGFLVAKTLPPIFRSRGESIQNEIQAGARAKAAAEAEVAAIERQIQGLGAEIEALRSQLKAEMAQEGERLKQETERLVKRVQEQGQQEIVFLTKGARQDLRAYSAELALDLAQQRIKNRMNPATQHALVDAFVHDLRGNGSAGA